MAKISLTDSQEVQVIAFKLGREEYAVDITSVQEIIMPQNKTKIPKSPEFVEGVINLRGNIIPVIDGRKRFGLELQKESSETRIMVLELESSTIGLTVDSVSEVIHLPTKDVQASPVNADNNTDFILGIGKFRDRLIILLDPDNFLDLKEIESIKNIAQVAQTMSNVTSAISASKQESKK